MADEPTSGRADVAQWIGTALVIIMLESHVMSRPLVFLFGPFVILLCMVLIAWPLPTRGLRRGCFIAVLFSVVGFLLTRYVFR
jgi:hypothetical protein